MKTLVLLTCVWLVTLGVVQCSQMPDMHMFSASDGALCELFELDRTDSMTMIGVNCHCQDERGHEHTYQCQYWGKLHECSEYRKDPAAVYSSLADMLKEHRNGCAAESIQSEMCDDQHKMEQMYEIGETNCKAAL